MKKTLTLLLLLTSVLVVSQEISYTELSQYLFKKPSDYHIDILKKMSMDNEIKQKMITVLNLHKQFEEKDNEIKKFITSTKDKIKQINNQIKKAKEDFEKIKNKLIDMKKDIEYHRRQADSYANKINNFSSILSQSQKNNYTRKYNASVNRFDNAVSRHNNYYKSSKRNLNKLYKKHKLLVDKRKTTKHNSEIALEYKKDDIYSISDTLNKKRNNLIEIYLAYKEGTPKVNLKPLTINNLNTKK